MGLSDGVIGKLLYLKEHRDEMLKIMEETIAVLDKAGVPKFTESDAEGKSGGLTLAERVSWLAEQAGRDRETLNRVWKRLLEFELGHDPECSWTCPGCCWKKFREGLLSDVGLTEK